MLDDRWDCTTSAGRVLAVGRRPRKECGELVPATAHSTQHTVRRKARKRSARQNQEMRKCATGVIDSPCATEHLRTRNDSINAQGRAQQRSLLGEQTKDGEFDQICMSCDTNTPLDTTWVGFGTPTRQKCRKSSALETRAGSPRRKSI